MNIFLMLYLLLWFGMVLRKVRFSVDRVLVFFWFCFLWYLILSVKLMLLVGSENSELLVIEVLNICCFSLDWFSEWVLNYLVVFLEMVLLLKIENGMYLVIRVWL